MDTEKPDLKWGRFWAQMAFAIFVMIIGALAGALFENFEGISNWQIQVAIGLYISAVLLTAVSYWKTLSNADEFERRIEVFNLAIAGGVAVFYTMNMFVLGYLEGSVAAPNPVSVFVAPGFLLMFRSIGSQHLRRRVALGKFDHLSNVI